MTYDFRWGFVVFGQIDGYSRLITEMHLSTDNKASSALIVFIKSIKEFGVPSRVRLDGGTEFNHVETLMNVLNGENRGTVMRGPSVHNQRIERLWRDVFCKVLSKFYKLFLHMERHNILDKSNVIHMYSLQYVFGPRIQNSLKDWTTAHNNHPIRTEKNQSPKMLWYGGSLALQNRNITAMNNLFHRDTNDVNEIANDFLNNHNLDEPESIKVVLPRYLPPLTDLQLGELKTTINPLGDSDSEAIDIYSSVVQFINNCVNM